MSSNLPIYITIASGRSGKKTAGTPSSSSMPVSSAGAKEYPNSSGNKIVRNRF